MALPSDYISGTITLTNGSTAFTGTGTGWLAAYFREGDIILDVEGGEGAVAVIASITSNTAGVLSKEWEGPTLTDVAYRMRYQWDSGRVSAQSRAAIEMLGNGNLQSFASITGPGVPVFDGPHSVTIKPESDFVNGVAYDVQVDTLADRDAYDGQSEGFVVLVSDVGDGRSALYFKNSNAVGDWSDPAYITGPVGPLPDVEATVTSLPPGSTATVTEVPITGGVRLDFELPEASGFYNAGVYDIAEAYNQDDVVRHNGSSFIALQSVPAGESPSSAFPPVDTAYWQVLAAKGQDGNITGITPFWQSRILNDADAAAARSGLELVKQNSVLDGDAGRLMLTGAFGLGGTSPARFTGNVDTLLVNGWRAIDSTATNLPVAEQGIMHTRMWDNDTAGYREFNAISSGKTYAQFRLSSTWGAWKEVGGGSKWEPIGDEVTVTTAVPSVAWSNLSAYRNLRLTATVTPNTDTAALGVRFGVSSGDAGANYAYQYFRGNGAVVDAGLSTAQAIAGMTGGMGTGAGRETSLTAHIFQFNKPILTKWLSSAFAPDSTGNLTVIHIGGRHSAATAMGYLEARVTTGLLAAGSTFTLEGMRG